MLICCKRLVWKGRGAAQTRRKGEGLGIRASRKRFGISKKKKKCETLIGGGCSSPLLPHTPPTCTHLTQTHSHCDTPATPLPYPFLTTLARSPPDQSCHLDVITRSIGRNDSGGFLAVFSLVLTSDWPGINFKSARASQNVIFRHACTQTHTHKHATSRLLPPHKQSASFLLLKGIGKERTLPEMRTARHVPLTTPPPCLTCTQARRQSRHV